MSNKAFQQAKEIKELLDHYNSLASAAKSSAKFASLSPQDKVIFNQVNNPIPYICCPIAPPEPPSGPVSLSLASGSAILNWTFTNSGQDGFFIYKSLNGVTYNTFVTLSVPSARTYSDSAVSASTTYWYELQPYNGEGTGSMSNTASITFGASAPTGPISLSVASASGAFLSWSYADSSQNGFNIFKSFDGLTYNEIYVLSSSLSRSFTDQNVIVGNTYWYEINAFNLGGTSSFSNTASIAFVTVSVFCHNSPYPPQLFTESLQVSLSYDLV